MENVIETKVIDPFTDNVKPGNAQLKPVNGKVFSIDAPGFPHQIATKPELSHILGIKQEANFLEIVTIKNSKGREVDTKNIEWHASIKITRESASDNFAYIDGEIGKGPLHG